jgi:hypothetical protein
MSNAIDRRDVYGGAATPAGAVLLNYHRNSDRFFWRTMRETEHIRYSWTATRDVRR